MSNYRRSRIAGGTYFLTQVTYQRESWLCSELGRKALREALKTVQKKYPFAIDAFVLLPDHFHCLWKMPEGDSDFSLRLRLVKTYVTKHYKNQLVITHEISASRQKRKESNLWQRRFWEHLIHDEADYNRHLDYIHYNPVKHGLCSQVKDWQYSSFHRYVVRGVYPVDWGIDEKKVVFSPDLDGE